LEPILVDLPEEVVLPESDKAVSDEFDASKGKPADWKQSSRWKDSYYCDVEEVTDYVLIAEPTKFWEGYLEREQCYTWC
jgi:hypothetical protein